MNRAIGRKNFTVRVNLDLQKATRHQAIDEERDLSDLVEDALSLYLETTKQAKGQVAGHNTVALHL